MADLSEKVKNLPKTPGVYIFRDEKGKVIYVGKAVNLKNRVSSYFQKNLDSIKTAQLVKNIARFEFLDTDSEVSALLLEAELVKRYNPKYNIDLKDDKNYLFLKIPKEDFPLPLFVRHPLDDGAKYIGPFTDARTVRRLLKLLRRVLPFRSPGDMKAKRACLYYHMGQCPGVCIGAVSKIDYAKNIRRIVAYFEGKGGNLEKELEREMKKVAKEKNFEEASKIRDKYFLLKKIKTLHIDDHSTVGSKEDKALLELKGYLDLENIPSRIECFDISNIQGKEAVGSMSVFINGVPDKKEYRRFKIRTVKGINDPAMMAETLRRRMKSFRHPEELATKDLHRNGEDEILQPAKGQLQNDKLIKPDLIVIDGGKGQISQVKKVLDEMGTSISVIGLAKREEEIWMSSELVALSALDKGNLEATSHELRARYKKIVLPKDSGALYLLQRIRDEAHRFAIYYHRSLHRKAVKKSELDNISGIGPKTKKKLLTKFGSVKKIKEANIGELEVIVGKDKAKKLREKI